MSLPVVLRHEARDDLVGALDWYERQSAGLSNQLTDALDQLLTRIGVMPELYAPVARGVRAVRLRRFPYIVYYRVLADKVEVVAILHGSRDPSVWRGRV